MNEKRPISKKERLELRKAAYYELWLGASAVWIAPCQHLLAYATDTEKDFYFLDQDRIAFVNHADTFEMTSPDGTTVYVNAKCQSDIAEKAMKAFFNRETQVIDFED